MVPDQNSRTNDAHQANQPAKDHEDDDAAFAALGNRAKEFQAADNSTTKNAPAAAAAPPRKDTHRDRVNQFLQRPFSPPTTTTTSSPRVESSLRDDQGEEHEKDNHGDDDDDDKDVEYADFQNTPPPSKQNSRDWDERDENEEEKDGPPLSPFSASSDRLKQYLPRLTMSNAHHRRITLYISVLAVLGFVALTAWVQTVVSRDEMKSDLFAPGQAAAEGAAAAQHGFPALGTTETSASPVGVGGDTGGSSSSSSSSTAEEGASNAVATPNEEKIMDTRVKVGNGKACFETLTDLKGAVDLYLLAQTDPSKQASFDAVFGDQYGQNIQEWCLGPNVVDLSHLFDANRNHNAAQFNQDISQWNVSHVQKMAGMFSGAEAFNQPIGAWDTRNVQSMGQMFLGAKSFNQDLSSWNTAKVQYMTAMFKGAAAFSQPLDKWDVSSVKEMSSMFQGAIKFNQPLNAWNVSNVADMSNMFSGARLFHQPLNAWDVSHVHKMKEMFMYAFAFNQPLDQWQPKVVEDMQNMFKKAGAFDQNLCNWAPYLTGREVNLQFMFRETSCNSIKDPNLKIAKPGPFCDWCGAGE